MSWDLMAGAPRFPQTRRVTPALIRRALACSGLDQDFMGTHPEASMETDGAYPCFPRGSAGPDSWDAFRSMVRANVVQLTIHNYNKLPHDRISPPRGVPKNAMVIPKWEAEIPFATELCILGVLPDHSSTHKNLKELQLGRAARSTSAGKTNITKSKSPNEEKPRCMHCPSFYKCYCLLPVWWRQVDNLVASSFELIPLLYILLCT